MFASALLALLDPFLTVFGLVAAGYAAQRTGWLPDATWPAVEKATYLVLIPALLIHALARADLAAVPLASLSLALGAAMVLATATVLAVRRCLASDGPALTSVVQGAVRINTMMGFGLAGALFGPTGVAIGGVVAGMYAAAVNVLVVVVFSLSVSRQIRPRALAMGIVANPLIVGCAIGAALNLVGSTFGVGLGGGIGNLLRLLGDAGIVLGLAALGAGLARLGGAPRLLTSGATSLVKLVGMPLATFVACRLLGVDAVATAVATMFMALPTAPAGYLLARQMGGDADLMAGLISVQTVLAFASLPLVLVAMGGVG